MNLTTVPKCRIRHVRTVRGADVIHSMLYDFNNMKVEVNCHKESFHEQTTKRPVSVVKHRPVSISLEPSSFLSGETFCFRSCHFQPGIRIHQRCLIRAKSERNILGGD